MLLEIEDLRTWLRTPLGVARAVDGVSLALDTGQTLALVGESGCGKSMLALSVVQLIPEPAGWVESGRILLDGEDLLDIPWSQMRRIRGGRIGMIFQEPMTSLNPVYTVGRQIIETIRAHHGGSDRNDARHAAELLDRVRISRPAAVLKQYPHELSGGMRQRVMIAIALANEPALLIADEPTTALDVTVQAQVLDLLRELQREMGMAMLLITHDLTVVRKVADSVAVMYAGQIVETAATEALFDSPAHPYTQGLMDGRPRRALRGMPLRTIEGIVPAATDWPPACRFEPRCPMRWEDCRLSAPRPDSRAGESIVRCHLYDPAFAPGRSADANREPGP